MTGFAFLIIIVSVSQVGAKLLIRAKLQIQYELRETQRGPAKMHSLLLKTGHSPVGFSSSFMVQTALAASLLLEQHPSFPVEDETGQGCQRESRFVEQIAFPRIATSQ